MYLNYLNHENNILQSIPITGHVIGVKDDTNHDNLIVIILLSNLFHKLKRNRELNTAWKWSFYDCFI